MKPVPRKTLPRAVADLDILAFLDAPAWLTRTHLRQLGAIVLPVQLFAVLPASAGQLLTLRGTVAKDYVALGLGYVLLYGGSMVSMALTALAVTAAVWGVEQTLHGRAFTARQALRWAARPGRLLTSLMVQFVVVMGAAFCVVPGLLAGMYLALTLPVMAAEDLTGGKAIDRSIALARHGKRGPWFTTTGAWTLALGCVFTLLNYSIGSLATLPAGIIGGWLGIKAAAEGGSAMGAMTAVPVWMLVILSVTAAFVYVLSYAYLAAGSVLLYRRAREITEGLDLAAALELEPDASDGGATVATPEGTPA